MDTYDRRQEAHEGRGVGICIAYMYVSFNFFKVSQHLTSWVRNIVVVLFLNIGLNAVGGAYVGSGSS